MQGNVHFHLRHACTVVQQIMIKRISQHYWETFKKSEIKAIRMYNGSFHRPGMMEEISKKSHKDVLI
jgi:hypothetical protein